MAKNRMRRYLVYDCSCGNEVFIESPAKMLPATRKNPPKDFRVMCRCQLKPFDSIRRCEQPMEYKGILMTAAYAPHPSSLTSTAQERKEDGDGE